MRTFSPHRPPLREFEIGSCLNLYQETPSWEYKFYAIQPRAVAFAQDRLQLFEGCDVSFSFFRGRMHFGAVHHGAGLQINFIESCTGDLSSLQSLRRVPPLMLISSGPCEWQGTSDMWGQGAELNADRCLVNSVFDEVVVGPIEDAIRRNGGRSLTVPLTGAGRALRMALYTIKMMTGVAMHRASMPKDEISPNYGKDALVELINNCLASVDGRFGVESVPNKIKLARDVEKLLWTSPLSRTEEFDFSLEEVSEAFGYSSRHVQIALQQTFGLGFVALRRIIRLHQFRSVLLRADSNHTIGSIAVGFHFNHFGRLAQEYNELFGSLPSVDKGALST